MTHNRNANGFDSLWLPVGSLCFPSPSLHRRSGWGWRLSGPNPSRHKTTTGSPFSGVTSPKSVNLGQAPRPFKPKKNRTRFLEFCRYPRSLYPAPIRIAIVLENFSPHLTTKKDTRVGD